MIYNMQEYISSLHWIGMQKDEHSGSQYISVFFITLATALGSKYLLKRLKKLSATITYIRWPKSKALQWDTQGKTLGEPF